MQSDGAVCYDQISCVQICATISEPALLLVAFVGVAYGLIRFIDFAVEGHVHCVHFVFLAEFEIDF